MKVAYPTDVMTREQLQDIVASGEDQGLEFHTGIPRVELIARHLAAFANTSGGRLLLGMGTARVDDGARDCEFARFELGQLQLPQQVLLQ